MTRVPGINPKVEKEVARLRWLLADLERIPPDRRKDEHADIRAQDIRAMLSDLEKR